jgi:hypothetical protein
MVGHQNISVKSKAVPLAVVLDTLEIGPAILIVVKGGLPPVPTHNDMIKRAFKLNSGFSRHPRTLSAGTDERQITQYSGLTLLPPILNPATC